MVLINALASKAVDAAYDQFMDKKKAREMAEREVQETINTDNEFNKTLAPGESTVISFNNKKIKAAIRNHYPMESVDAYNGTGENLELRVNQKKSLVLPLPDGAQNGDSFENVGIRGIEIVNVGSSQVNLENLKLTVSAEATGVARGSV